MRPSPPAPRTAGVATAIVLLNPSAGADRSTDPDDLAGRVAAALAAAGVRADVRTSHGGDIVEMAEQAVGEGADAVIAAGGDGTVNAVAAAVLRSGGRARFGVLPVGTLNHFARDLGMPLTLPEAAAVIAAGHTRVVDVGEVNGRAFLNNSSIGLYPRMVRDRDRQRERLGRGKWVAMLVAAVRVFRRYPMLRVAVDVGTIADDPAADRPRVVDAGERRPLDCTTPFVFVGNNRYEVDLFALGTRPALDRGELSVYFTPRTGRFGLLWLALRGIFGRLEQARDFESHVLPACRIEARGKRLRVSVDGEVIRLRPPLEYRVRPAALTVLAPPAASGNAG